MRDRTELSPVIDIGVTTRGELPGVADYARRKIGELGRLVRAQVEGVTDRLGEPIEAIPLEEDASVVGELLRGDLVGAGNGQLSVIPHGSQAVARSVDSRTWFPRESMDRA